MKSTGTIPLAILSIPTFGAASHVDASSLTFGRIGDETSLAFCNKSPEDVNGDGLLDLGCHFDTQRACFRAGDTIGILRGRLLDGALIVGRDSIRTFCPGDVNGDFTVNDLALLGVSFMSVPGSATGIQTLTSTTTESSTSSTSQA